MGLEYYMKNKNIISFSYLSLYLFIFLCLNIGCDSQKSFKPKQIDGKVEFNSSLNKSIISTNRESARLKDNTIITNNGITNVALLDKENLLFSDSKQWLVANGCFGLTIIPIKIQTNNILLNRNNSKDIKTQGCVVSASIKNNIVAGILADNTIFIYDLEKGKMIFQEKGEAIYAISSLNANPIILDTLIVFPTLDGRLNTIDIKQGKSIKNIIVNTDKFLNNIIYLRIIKDELVSATSKKIYTLIKGESYSKDIEIRDIYFDGIYIYALSLNGFIYKFDKSLAIIKSIKLPYANLNGIIIKDNYLYTFENSGGYLIELNLDSFTYQTFKLNFGMDRWFSKNITLFYTQNILYINKKILNFNEVLQKVMVK